MSKVSYKQPNTVSLSNISHLWEFVLVAAPIHKWVVLVLRDKVDIHTHPMLVLLACLRQSQVFS